ncbi:MAG: RNase adapter RapZ [Stagnimonas sp.]|nr:RNase adapter RapZ [Stagnimonas sp.]
MKLVVVSGLSGAGKTVALRQYEDLGWYCIDNIPLDFVEPLVAHALINDEPRYARMAIGVDARESPTQIAYFPDHLESLRTRGVDVDVLFLTASEEIILKRYSETRRKHPLSDEQTSLVEAINIERALLAPIANAADVTLDTTRLNLHELRSAIDSRMPGSTRKLSVLFLSFGFKNGMPDGADYVFDVRCLPNPHWVPELRPLNGRDAAIAEYLSTQPEVTAMQDDITRFLDRWLPTYEAQDRAYVTIAIGCTGGQHRSVYLVEQLAPHFKKRFAQVVIKHRELT